MTTKTKYILWHAAFVVVLAFMWMQIFYLLDTIEQARSISEAWKTPSSVLAVAAAIAATVYIVVEARRLND